MNPRPIMLVWKLVWVISSFALSLAVPSVCQASCGDYLVATGTDAPALHESPSSSPGQPSTPDRPCFGAACSRHTPAFPAPLAPNTANPDLEGWLGLAGLLPCNRPGVGTFASQRTRISPLDLGSAIFHPPRRSA